MEALIKAASDFLAAILATLGFIGRPRRRAAIRDDLALLQELGEHPDFGRDSWPHHALFNHVSVEIGKFSGVEFEARRKIQWGSVVLSFVLAALFGFLTYAINDDGFRWYSIIPGFVAATMATAFFGLLFAPDPQAPDPEAPEEATVSPE